MKNSEIPLTSALGKNQITQKERTLYFLTGNLRKTGRKSWVELAFAWFCLMFGIQNITPQLFKKGLQE